MSLTEFQRRICRLIASIRIASGESYVAGGAALNELLGGSRVSRDVDLFHDSREALLAAWSADRGVLERAGFCVKTAREFPSFVEAEVSSEAGSVMLQWAQDSAYRFFPLVEHPDFGATLHPFDLATNKVLALVGRVEVRDWVDVLTIDKTLQPFGYLAWAACGKDPGLNPQFLLEQARRSGRYTKAEFATLEFSELSPDANGLSERWRKILAEAEQLIEILPAEHIGCCITDTHGNLIRAQADELEKLLQAHRLHFHPGRLRGAWPRIIDT